jgi:hypothetical protein
MKKKVPEKPVKSLPATPAAAAPAAPPEAGHSVGTKLPVSNEDQAILLQLQKATVDADNDLGIWLLNVELEKQQRLAQRNQTQQNLMNATRAAAIRSGVDLKADGLWTWQHLEQTFIRTK